MKQKIIKYSLYFWLIFVSVLTLSPMEEYNGTVETYYDKVAHFFLFGIFSFLLYCYLRKKIYKTKFFIVSITAGTAYSLIVEFLQIYIPGRNASELDFFAGVFGSLCFSFIAVMIFKNKK